MRQIFKNYLATFIKNWLQTIGTVLFILMMFAVVIGFLAAPLQIYAHIQSMNTKNNKFNDVVDSMKYKYNSQFLYKFLYDNEGVYKQHQIINGVEQPDNNTTPAYELIREAGLTDPKQQLLSPIFKDAITLNAGYALGSDNKYAPVKFTSDYDKYDSYASYLNNGLNAYRSGALAEAGANFTLGVIDDEPTLPQINVSNLKEANLVSEFKKSINNIVQSDAYIEPNWEKDTALIVRVVNMAGAMFSNNDFGKSGPDLQIYMTKQQNNFVKWEDKGLLKDGVININTTTDPWNNTQETLNAGFNDWMWSGDEKKTLFSFSDIRINGQDLADTSHDIVSANAGGTSVAIKLGSEDEALLNNKKFWRTDQTAPEITINGFRNGSDPITLVDPKDTDKMVTPTSTPEGKEVTALNASSDFGSAIIDLMRMDMLDKNIKTKTVHLIANQMFFDDPYKDAPNKDESKNDSSWSNRYNSSSMYQKLTTGAYSNDFLNYVMRAAFGDSNNLNAFNGNNPNYRLSIEKSMYFSESVNSNFPTKSVVLKTANSQNDPNQIQLVDGRLPEKLDINRTNRRQILQKYTSGELMPEIVINSGYASSNNLKVGDTFTIPQGNEYATASLGGATSSDNYLTQGLTFKIVGIGEKFNDAVPGEHYTPFMEKISSYTNAYVDDGFFDLLKDAKWNNSTSGGSDFLSEIRITNNKGVNVDPRNVFDINYNNSNANNGLYDVSKNPFVAYGDTKTMASVNNTKIKVIIFIILGIAVLILAFIFINFIITKELNETRRQIGIFKSFGYKISELSWIFAIKTFLTIFVGALFGWIVSIGIQTWSATSYTSQVMFHFDTVYAGAAFMCIILIVIPVIFLAVSYIMTLFYLKEPTLSLLSNGAKVKKGKTHVSALLRHLAKTGKGFGYRLQQGFIKDSMGKFVVVQILFAIASLTFTLMFGAQDLMYGIANQGFAVLNKNADHGFYWANQDGIDIPYTAKGSDEQGKYTFVNQQKFIDRDFTYTNYSAKEKIGKVIDEAGMSESRYRENYLVSSIANTFDVSKTQAMEMLNPIDYLLVHDANVSPADLPSMIDNLENGENGYDKVLEPVYRTDADGDKVDMLKEAAVADSSIKGETMTGMEMAYHDDYLNWILTFRIGQMNDIDKIKSELISGTKFNLDTLVQYETKNPDSYIPISKIINDPNGSKDAFADTLFGLTAKTGTQKNNLFLSDVTKIVTLVLAEKYENLLYQNQINAVTPINLHDSQAKKWIYKPEDVVKSLQKGNSDSLLQSFSPQDMKYWSVVDSPITAAMKRTPIVYAPPLPDAKASSTSASSGGGLSLPSSAGQTVSLIMGASMLGYNGNLEDMPVITINQAFFDKNTDSLFYNVPITGIVDNYLTNISLFDFKNEKFGNYDNALTHEGVSDETYKKLAEPTGDDNSIYAVIPYVMARTKGLKVGDKYTVSTDTKNKRSITLDIIGINRSVTYSLSGWTIDADYDQFTSKFFDQKLYEEVNTDNGTHPLFNEMISSQPMLKGNINLNDISDSINSMRFVGKNIALSINPDASIFGSVFKPLNPSLSLMISLLGSKTDASYRLVTNPNVASTSFYSSVDPYNILRAGVDNGIDMINNILIVFMVLVAVMLLIILVVVMNIIVEQATPIILTLKSLGYNQREINWITMGSYITGAIISFVVAYCISLAVWNIFLAVAGELWHIYVFMTYSWKAPVITFLVVGAILAFGWYVSDRKVERIPLTLVTGFN